MFKKGRRYQCNSAEGIWRMVLPDVYRRCEACTWQSAEIYREKPVRFVRLIKMSRSLAEICFAIPADIRCPQREYMVKYVGRFEPQEASPRQRQRWLKKNTKHSGAEGETHNR